MAILISRDGTELKGAGNVTSLSAENKKIVNLANPSNNQDAATKSYVDGIASGAANAVDNTFSISNAVDSTKKIDFDASGITTGNIRTILMADADVNLALVNSALQSSEKGAANGVATLNALGKLTASQVPALAITETFVVADIAARNALVIGSGDGQVQEGDVAVVIDASADPAVDSGGASYIYDGSAWQRLLSPSDAVQSVNALTGVVVLDTDDIGEGSNLYYTQARFDTAFSGKSTSNLSEGSNLYFTTARVLATALSGLSLSNSSAVEATDTILQAIGKLQARSKLNNLVAGAAPTVNDDSGDGYENGSLWYDTAGNALYVLEDSTLGAAVWQKVTADQAVTSVNSQTGVVVLDSDDIAEGSSNLYYTSARFDADLATKDTDDLAEGSNLYYTQTRFDDAFAAKDSDDLAEGSVNLYFTDARAKSAAVANSITDGVTDVAPSQNAVFDALALKADASSVPASTSDLAEGTNLYFTDARAKLAAVADSITNGVLDIAPSQNAVFDALALKADDSDVSALEADNGKVFDAGVAGENFEINQIHLVRRAKSGETAGRYYKAQADSFANSRVVGFIIVGATQINAADAVRVYKFGEVNLGSADTLFGAANINAPVYLNQSTAGKFTLTPSTSSGAIIKPIGYVANDGLLEFQPSTAIQA